MEKEFIRVRSVKDIVITFSLIITGSICVALPTSQSINVLGFFMIFAGLIIALVVKTGYKETGSGENFKKTEHYFQQEMNAVISSALKNNPGSIDLTQADKGNAIKLDIYYSQRSGKAYLQLFEYIPYKYEPCSNLYEYEMSQVERLIK